MAGDIYFDKVELLLHCNGSNGSTTFTDSGPDGRTVTPSGNASISTAQSKFGGASAAFDGTGDFLSIADATSLRPGSSDFTVEMWARIGTTASNQIIINKGIGTGYYALQILYETTAAKFRARGFDVSNSSAYDLYADGPTPSTGTWYHLALCRSGSTIRFYVDGALAGSANIGTTALNGTTGAVTLGALDNGVAPLNGYLDDVRYTVGAARYTGSTFSVPTEAYPDAMQIQGRSSAAGPMGAAQPLAYNPIVARSEMPIILGTILALGSDTTRLTRAQANGPLGAALSISTHSIASWSEVPGPLGSVGLLAWSQNAIAAAAGPLGPMLAVGMAVPFGTAQVSGPLGALLGKSWNSSPDAVPADAPVTYTCDLVYGGNTVRLPISSWQATIQTSGASYLQVVVPGLLNYADDIAEALTTTGAEIVINKGARLDDGSLIEAEMARGPLETVTTDRGPTNYTGTLSGYADAWTPDPSPPAVSARTLSKVRSISSTNGLYRARCAIDWLLQPGLTAVYGDVSFTADYINFYVTSDGDAYADVGQSAAS